MYKAFRFAACFSACLGACLAVCAATAASPAPGPSMTLTTDVPACAMPPGPVLPAAYYAARDHGKPFDWAASATRAMGTIGGDGFERFDGANLHDSFQFARVDLNGDGVCDWFVTMNAPDSSGGDRDTLDTLYLGGSTGWRRIGASVAAGDVDALGSGTSDGDQRHFLFGEGIATIRDAAANVDYFVTAFYDRNVQQAAHPGYRIFTWDAASGSLRLLDKWAPRSPAASVYAFFKAHGAHVSDAAAPGGLAVFDPDVEANELRARCKPGRSLATDARHDGPVSPALLTHCPKE